MPVIGEYPPMTLSSKEEREERYYERRREELECDDEFWAELWGEFKYKLTAIMSGEYSDSDIPSIIKELQKATTDRINARIAKEIEGWDEP